MTINAVQATSTAVTGSRDGAKLAADFDGFLKLLTTQLQTQDPLSPMDAEQFTSQLVQFSGVEQAIQSNAQLKTLVGLMQSTQHTAAMQYVGATVQLDSSRIHLPVGGEADISYALPAPAANVRVSVVDTDGKIVRTLEGPGGVGPQSLTWNGLDNDRRSLPAGNYVARVEATNAAGEPLGVSLTTTGRVDALLQTTEGLVLRVDGRDHPLDAVRAIVPAA